MSDEDAFLAGIAADRADRTRLLVFADWLADRADPREEFVRVHTRLLDMDGTEPEFEEHDKVWRLWTHTPVRFDCMPQMSGRLSAQWLDAICRVCTTAHVEEYAANGRDPEPLCCEMSEFGQYDHRVSDSEETLVLYHGKPDDYETPFEFVSETLLVDLDPFLERGAEALATCEPATRGQFWTRWQGHLAGLRKPPPLPVVAADNLFLGAQFVRGDWNNWGVVATYQSDYFALFWSTTD